MNQKFQLKIYYANVNVNLMEENIIQINDRIMINVDVTVKKHHICEKGCIWNPASCSWENKSNLASIVGNSAITCDEIIDAEAKLYDEETKTI